MAAFFTPRPVLLTSTLLRLVFLLYGLYQDAHSPLPYTDIDYWVFTSAASYVSRHRSPYQRETYRYTPLLAWLLLPTTWDPQWLWFSFGKVLFALSDIVAGGLMVKILMEKEGMAREAAWKYASLWLLNPMVVTISTRGSSEGLLGVMVVGVVWAVVKRRTGLAGVLLGLAVHFKIYPFIYGASILWYLETPASPSSAKDKTRDGITNQIYKLLQAVLTFLNSQRLLLLSTSLATFTALNLLMYSIYGRPFLQHTYLHHLTRIDHRHNFSPYNVLLHLSSAAASSHSPALRSATSGYNFESLAFIPQLALSAVIIPLVLAKRDLPSTMMAQTWAFVALNKVVTSQYFLWYLVLLPFYLPQSSLLANPRLGCAVVVLWVGSQALHLHQAYLLEYKGISTFVPGLWLSSLFFYSVNMWILGIVVGDIGALETRKGIRDVGAVVMTEEEKEMERKMWQEEKLKMEKVL